MKVCQKCYTEVEDHTRFCPNCGTQVIEETLGDEDRMVGRTLAGKFLLKVEIGAGAMGRIYKAEQINLGRDACIKILHPHLMGDPTLSRRFHREARAASRLKHPNCINVIDFGIAEDDNVHYIAMDFLDGRDLAHVIRDDFPIDPLRIVHLCGQICAALDEAHAAGVIHRDLKPENVFVEDRRHAKDYVTVLDFGIAKIKDRDGSAPETFATMAGIVCGTPEYMSPEQARGDTLDARSDLYALGVILFHMITGRLPFTGETPIGIVTKHLTEPPPDIRELNPNCHPDLVDLTNRLLSKDKELRPSSAMGVKRELDRFRRTLEEDTKALYTTAPMARPESLKPRQTPTPVAPDPDATEPARDSAWDIPSKHLVYDEPPIKVSRGGAGRWVVLLLLLGALGAGGWYLYTNVLFVKVAGPPAEAQTAAAGDGAEDTAGGTDATPEQPPVSADAAAAPASDGVEARDVAAPDVTAEDLRASDTAPVEPGAGDAAGVPEVAPPEDVVDPQEEARDRVTERIAALSGVLQVDKNMLVARQSALVKHEATWLAMETASAIQAISELEARIGAARSDLAAGEIAKAAGALETIKKDVKEAHTANKVLLDRPIPTEEEVTAHREATERVRSLDQELAKARDDLATLKAALEAKRDAWAGAMRTDRVEAVAGELEILVSLQTRHGALNDALAPELVNDQTAAARTLAEECAALGKRTEPILKARVRSRAEEDEERKLKDERERKRKEEEERKRKEEEERKRKEEEARAKAAEKAAAEAEFQTLVTDADAARSQGNYAAAIGLYKQALKRKDSTSIRERLGKAYNATEQHDKAAEQFRVCVGRLESSLAKTTDEAQKKKLQGKIDLIKGQIRE
ncbi:MAG: protein kinase [Pseudomonadota bacterium]